MASSSRALRKWTAEEDQALRGILSGIGRFKPTLELRSSSDSQHRNKSQTSTGIKWPPTSREGTTRSAAKGGSMHWSQV